MPTDFNGKWVVASSDDNAVPFMKKQGYGDDIIAFIKDMGCEIIHKGNDLTLRFDMKDGTTTDETYTVGGAAREDTDLKGRPQVITAVWQGDALLMTVTSVDPSFHKTTTLREINGDTMIETSVMVDTGMKTVTTLKRG